ncbi:MAG: tRNA pseudouridine(13) synthase TruD [Planctomycetota bacterium]
MRLKVRPEDFRVRELLQFEEDPRGEHYVHLLRKEKLDTVQALTEVSRVCGVSRRDIAFAGLKDRQGVTEQWISVRGRRLDLRRRDLQVVFFGRASKPITSKQSAGNAFEVVLRELRQGDVERLQARVASARESGFPNYFDDQRFGNVKHGQGFILRDVLKGDYDAALRSLIAEPSPKAITGDVKLKRILRAKWGDWDACAAIARGPAFRRVFGILQRGGDAREALAALPPRTKLIHAYAFQSYLWNRALSRWLRLELTQAQQSEVWTVLGRLRAWSKLPAAKVERIERMEAPLFAGDLAGGEPSFRAALDAVLRREEVTVADCVRAELPGLELKTELRKALVVPGDLRLAGPRPDKHGHGLAMKLSFSLPRGAYATMLVKCLTASKWGAARRATEK